MKKRLRKFQGSPWLVAVVLAVAAVAMLPSVPLACNSSASAAVTSPNAYCFQTDLTVTYAGGGTLTDQPVRFELPASAMVAAQQLDSRGWDAYGIQGSFGNGQHFLFQETGDTTSGNWVIVPSIDNTTSENFRLYTGQNERRRDQSIWFTGGDFVTVSDHADFDITDNLEIHMFLTNHSDTARDETILEKASGGSGYQVEFEDVASALTLTFDVDGIDCELTWDSAWTDNRQKFRFSYISDAGVDARIYRNDVLAQTCDTDAGALGTTATDLIFGSNTGDTTPVQDLEIHSVDIEGAALYHFNANSLEETSETNPFTGTVADRGPNGHTGTYTFDRDQTNLTVSVSPTSPLNLTTSAAISQEIVDILGGVLPDSVLSPGAEQTGGFIFDVILDPLADVGLTRKVTMALVLTFLGLIMGVGMYVKTDKKFMPLAATVAAFPVWIGAFNNWVDWWYGAAWAMIILFTWFAFRRSEEPA